MENLFREDKYITLWGGENLNEGCAFGEREWLVNLSLPFFIAF